MKKSEWNEALNHIDDDIVANFVAQKETLQKKKKTRAVWIRACAIAACISIVFCSFAVVPMLFDEPNSEPPYNGSESAMNGGAATEKPTKEYGYDTYTSIVPVGDLDFEGDSITILHRNTVSAQREWYKNIRDDDLDEVISMRNELISETLNLYVEYKAIGGADYEDCFNAFNEAIKTDVNNDMHEYDVVANHAYAGASAEIRDYLANLADREIFSYFDFSLSCWNQSIVRNTTINDKLYYITGDINLSTFDKSMVVFLNQKMYDEKKTDDDPEDLQDLALEGYDSKNKVGKSGGFTYDELYRWASVFEEGNGEDGDFHAISSEYGTTPLDSLPYAWDLDYINENADGSHAYNIVGNAKIEGALNKARKLLDGSVAKGVSNENIIANFASDKSIFALHVLYNNEAESDILRSMSSEYRLLPMPKYDKNQLDYGTTACEDYTLITVIDHSLSSVPTKGRAVSAYLQYLAEESYTNVRRYYVENVMKLKKFRDYDTEAFKKSVQIFNIIANSIELPFVSVYAPQLNNIMQECWREAVISGITAEEAYQNNQDIYDSKLAELDSWLEFS